MEPGNTKSTATECSDDQTDITHRDRPDAGVDGAAVADEGWGGPNDPGNPKNWHIGKRIYHAAAPAFFCFTVAISSSLYVSGIKGVMHQFHVSQTVALLGLTFYVVGLGCGPILAAPISETRGRLAVYRVCLPLFALFTMGAGLAPNFATIVVCRFFAGLFGGPTMSVIAGTNADIWHMSSRAPSSALMALSTAMGPGIGPVIGGFIAEHKSWRWTQWTVLMFVAVSAVGVIGMSETYAKIILSRRARSLEKEPAEKPDSTARRAAFRLLLRTVLFRPLSMLFTEPIILFFSLYTAFSVAILFVFFEAYPYVFINVYGFTPGQTGLTFLSICVGCICAALFYILLDRVIYKPMVRKSVANGLHGIVPPEHRLYGSMIGSFCIPLSLFWFGWTARTEVSWVSPVLAGIPFGFGIVLIFLSSAMYMVDTYAARTAASALAANGFMRYTLCAIFPLFSAQLYTNLGIGWASSVFGFITVAMMPIPWVLFKWGPIIRKQSRYETVQF